ncbi:MAG: ATP-binding protein [Candidatus Coatesbacteria bacterium]|nr:ATP-binding protein [Candidatus Coatesbacteria bacterium]
MTRDIFDKERLSPALDSFLRETNPWWEGKPAKRAPVYRRAVLDRVRRRLENGIAPVTVLRGPRRVGKTTIQEQLIEYLLQEKGVNPARIFRIQFDDIPSLKHVEDPILALCRWYQNRILGRTFNEAAQSDGVSFLFFDEAQNLDSWAEQVKALVDLHEARVLVTGSSALRIGLGRDSLAGRISTLDLGPLYLREIAGLKGYGDIPSLLPDNGLALLLDIEFWRGAMTLGLENKELRDLAFADFSERGGYPESQIDLHSDWATIAAHLNETVIKRAIQHDLRLGDRGRKRDAHLLEEVFRSACRRAGQSPGPEYFEHEIRIALRSDYTWQKIRNYLEFLDSAMLLRLVAPMEIRCRKKRGNYKICLCDHALRASWLQEVIPLYPKKLMQHPHLSDLAGFIAESVAGFCLGTIHGLDLSYFPTRGVKAPEVDFVLTIGEKRIPIEIKYQRTIDPQRDTQALRSFLDSPLYNAPFGVLVTMLDDVEIPDPRIVALPLSSLLLIV